MVKPPMPCSRDELLQLANETLQPQAFDDYCPNGLQVEGGEQLGTLVAGVTACQQLLDAAVELGANAVLVHHGYFWRGESQALTGAKYRRLKTLFDNDINLLAYHLPLDAHAVYGNNTQLAQLLGIDVSGVAASVGQDLLWQGTVAEALSGQEMAARLKARLGRNPVHIDAASRPIQRLAWCTGGAQHYIHEAIELGVDAYISGEISEQTTHTAREAGIHYFAAGHHATERYGVQALGRFLADSLGLEFQFVDIDNPA